MKILFFIVHPTKFYLFNKTFQSLKKMNIHYDILISSKDVLAELLDKEGYKYIDLFPKGRKIKNLPILFNAVINLLRTLVKLFMFIRGKKYNLFITDDVLTIVGKIINTPSIIYNDNDLVTIPKLKILFQCADIILTPSSTDMRQFNSKRITFNGNKALAHLAPSYFTADKSIIAKYNLTSKKYCVLRLVNLNATHDVNNNVGLYGKALDEIIPSIIKNYKLIISSEKKISKKFNEYQIIIDPLDFPHILAFAEFLITDSGSVATEAAVLGVPNILINSIANQCGVLKEMKVKYSIMDYYDYYDDSRCAVFSIINGNYNKADFKNRLVNYLIDADDVNHVIINTILKYKL